MILNAENKIIGRLASYAAKKAMLGEEVIIVNCAKAVISGDKREIIEKYRARRERRTIRRGPFFPKSADRIVKRMIRGMLPYKQEKGKKALKRVKCYVSIPKAFQDKEIIDLKQFNKDKLPNTKYMTLKDLSKELGAKYE